MRTENNNGNYIIRYYGITQDPKTRDFMIVTQYAKHGNLRNYYQQNSKIMTWRKRLKILCEITIGLTAIHKYDIMHKNLHSGNVLIHFSRTLLGDLRSSHQAYCIKPSVKNLQRDYYNENDGRTFEVLPFMAPEVLCGKTYTKSSDIYSFGIIMWELAHLQKPPFLEFTNYTVEVEENVVIIPEVYVKLMKKCTSPNPCERPSAEELYSTIGGWLSQDIFASNSCVSQQFKVAEEWRVELEVGGENYPKKLASKLVSWA